MKRSAVERRWRHCALAALAAGLALAEAPPELAALAAAAAAAALAATGAPRAAAVCLACLLAGLALGHARLEAIDAPGERLAPGERVAGRAHLLVAAPRGAVRRDGRDPARLRGPGAGREAGRPPAAPRTAAAGARGRAPSWSSRARVRRPPRPEPVGVRRPRLPPAPRHRGRAERLDGARHRAAPRRHRGADRRGPPARGARAWRAGCRPRRRRWCAAWCSARTSGSTRRRWTTSATPGSAICSRSRGQNVMLLAALALPLLAAAGLPWGARIAGTIALIAPVRPARRRGPVAPARRGDGRGRAGRAAGLEAGVALVRAAARGVRHPRAQPARDRRPGLAALLRRGRGHPAARAADPRSPHRAPAAARGGRSRSPRRPRSPPRRCSPTTSAAVPAAGLAANLAALPLVAPIMWLGMVRAALGQAAALGGPSNATPPRACCSSRSLRAPGGGRAGVRARRRAPASPCRSARGRACCSPTWLLAARRPRRAQAARAGRPEPSRAWWRRRPRRTRRARDRAGRARWPPSAIAVVLGGAAPARRAHHLVPRRRAGRRHAHPAPRRQRGAVRHRARRRGGSPACCARPA